MKPRTPLFLMANLGSEMNRLFDFSESGDIARVGASAQRALKIIADIEALAPSTGLKKELSILKQLIDDKKARGNLFTVSRADLDQYFAPLALKALVA